MIEADHDGVRELWRVTWRASYAARLGQDAERLIAASLDGSAISSMFAIDGATLLAIGGGEIVGSVCFVERGAVAYLWGMYVHPDHQRAGIGTALLRAAAATIREAEWLDCATVDAAALAFYLRLGFSEQGPGSIELFPDWHVPSTRIVTMVRHLRESIGRP